jgi:hypothetical protein
MAFVALACAVSAVGCESGVKRIPTSGEVTLDGKPFSGGVLMFSPDPAKGNTARVGCTGAVSNGKFNLVTAGMSKADTGSGAPTGWFKVTYMHPDEGSLKEGASVPKVADRFKREETTPISIELTDPPPPGGYKVELTSK